MADGIIKDTDIFEIEEKLKNIEGYDWSEDHGVIEGRTGYFGTCLCEEQDIWCDLYGDDNYEVESASIDVYEEDFELLITFASFFDTGLIDVEAVQQWIREYDNNDSASQIFGDAEFTMFYGLQNDEKYTLSIRALE